MIVKETIKFNETEWIGLDFENFGYARVEEILIEKNKTIIKFYDKETEDGNTLNLSLEFPERILAYNIVDESPGIRSDIYRENIVKITGCSINRTEKSEYINYFKKENSKYMEQCIYHYSLASMRIYYYQILSLSKGKLILIEESEDGKYKKITEKIV